MHNKKSGEKIKELRIARGLSQAELANKTALSVRTIQRIENSETDPRGDSLLKLAGAFNIAPEELTVNHNHVNDASTNNHTYLVLLNLSALSFIFFPLFAVIVPLVLWSLKKDTEGIDRVAKPLINFQLSCLLLGLAVLMLAIANQELGWRLRLPYKLGGYSIPETLFFGVPAINIVYIFFNTLLLLTKRPVMYQPAIPFFKIKQ